MLLRSGVALLFAVGMAGFAVAEDSDLVEGEKLYRSQCQLCHGSVSEPVGMFEPVPPVRIAMRPLAGITLTDVPVPYLPEAGSAPERVAVAMPFGPHLRGIVGRQAGSVPGYTYSSTLLKNLQGMEWNEAALNVWITNPQAWVPGVFMYYKQKDPEVRRKIILYLKANS
jgi:cytochrome c2